MGSETPPARWLNWLHGFGYVTTGVIALQAIVIAALGIPAFYSDLSSRAEQKRENRTREGPVRASAFLSDNLAALPTVEPGSDTLRFVTDASGYYQHALLLSLRHGAAEATGTVVLTQPHPKKAVRIAHFTMPPEAHRKLMQQIDAHTDGWPGKGWGNACQTRDGRFTAFERGRGNRVTSGGGFCLAHYDRLGTIVYQGIRANVPCEAMNEGEPWREVGEWKMNCPHQTTPPLSNAGR
ncbi:hypothetical protein ACFOMD_06600 [Sphingoaurantiacus capsulatus]|uniref:Uncharacterized protein n=1 Tax=Sphingoaurantiacus capsulatus TaxID=1771310 RepID=A0ABV7X7Y9_9SPHN